MTRIDLIVLEIIISNKNRHRQTQKQTGILSDRQANENERLLCSYSGVHETSKKHESSRSTAGFYDNTSFAYAWRVKIDHSLFFIFHFSACTSRFSFRARQFLFPTSQLSFPTPHFSFRQPRFSFHTLHTSIFICHISVLNSYFAHLISHLAHSLTHFSRLNCHFPQIISHFRHSIYQISHHNSKFTKNNS